MVVRLFRVIVPVPDIERATGWYRALLGQDGERVAANRHYFDAGGGVILALVGPGEREAFRPLPDYLYLSVPDVAATFDHVRGLEAVEVESGIEERPWGERSFYVRDPFGNPLCFVERGTEFTGGRFVP